MTEPVPTNPADITELLYQTALEQDAWPELLEALGTALQLDDEASADQSHSVPPSLSKDLDRLTKLLEKIDAVEKHNNLITAVMDTVPFGIVTLDASATLLQANRFARDLLRDGPILATNNEGTIVARDRKSTTLLHDGVHRAATMHSKPKGELFQLKSGDERDALNALVQPLRSEKPDGARPTVALFLATRDIIDDADNTVLGNTYGFTRSENRLLRLLLAGYSLADTASALGVSIHTCRSQLRSLFSKTGTNRQPELLREVFASAIMCSGLDNTEQAFAKLAPSRVSLPDGRTMAYAEYGDPDGIPVLFHANAVGSRLQRHPNDALTRELKIRLIVPDRAGIGLSDPCEDYSYQQWAADATHLLDALGITKVAALGFCMGAPFACALARMHPDRVSVLGIVGGCAAGPPLATDRTHPVHRMIANAAIRSPGLHRFMIRVATRSAIANPDSYFGHVQKSLCKSDAEALQSPEIRNNLISSGIEGARQGSSAIARDMRMQLRPWGFEPEAICAPSVYWFGVEDQMASIGHARQLAGQLPECETRFRDARGHLLIYQDWSEILQTLSEYQ